MARVRRFRLAALGLLCLALPATTARAETIVDPQPPLRWAELLNCELVVAAKYKVHQPGKVALEVVRVLHGKGVKAGDVLTVRLEHWYSVETGLVGFNVFRSDRKPDGVARLCYKAQVMDPGEPVPMPIVKDFRQPAVYFLPKAADPALIRRGQVQLPLLADGWQQALDRRPMDLLFRLVQTVNPALARDALEELYARRDPRALDQLFAWIMNPPPTGELEQFVEVGGLLQRLGDRKGDVYDRARKLFVAEAQGTNPYARFALGRILAVTDRARAARDFAQFLERKSTSLRETTVYCIGHLDTEPGLDLAFRSLNKPPLTEAAVSALRTLLMDRSYDRRGRVAEWACLRELARPRLRSAVASADLPAAVKLQLRQIFPDLLDECQPLDLTRAEKLLLDPNDRSYQGMADGEAHRVYEAALRTFDARLVPLLARVLHEVPPARGPQAYRFRETLLHYAGICPNALKVEMARRDIDLKRYRDVSHELTSRLLIRLRTPRSADHLAELARQRGGDAWLRRKLVPDETLQMLSQRIEQGLETQADSLPWDIDLLLRIDRAEGRQVLDRALPRREHFAPNYRADLLALAVRDGRAEYLDELLRIPTSGALLAADDDRALALYLKKLDAGRKLAESRFNNAPYLDYSYTDGLQRLFPRHAPAFFERVAALLESPHLPERVAGVEALEHALHADHGFQAADFAPVRAEQLARLRPLLKRLAGLTEAGMRAAVLRDRGVKLEGAPGPAWVPALTRAALSEDPAVGANALLLLEEVADVPGCSAFFSLRPAERERVLQARLRDEREGRKELRLTRSELEARWADLGRPRPRAYPASAALVAAPRDSLPFLKEVLRPVTQVDADRIRRLIADLGDRSFAVREKATRELQRLGERAGPFLRAALRAPNSLEVSRRVQTLLKPLEQWTEGRRRTVRAVDLLEALGTPEARALLESLAGGVPGAFLTDEARAALRRLDRRLASY